MSLFLNLMLILIVFVLINILGGIYMIHEDLEEIKKYVKEGGNI